MPTDDADEDGEFKEVMLEAVAASVTEEAYTVRAKDYQQEDGRINMGELLKTAQWKSMLYGRVIVHMADGSVFDYEDSDPMKEIQE